MTTKTNVKILGWRAEGFRCPDHEVNFQRQDSTPYPITLLQMPNGTGKTTTLNLLRGALGGPTFWEVPDKAITIQELRKDLSQIRGVFTLTLLCNSKRLTITQIFDFQLSTVRYKTTFGSGAVDVFGPPAEIRHFLCNDFVRFFVFDGELANQLLDRRFTNARNAIEGLFHISLFKSLGDKVAWYWEELTRDVKVAGEKGLNRRKNARDRIFARLKEVTSAKEADEKALRQVQKQLATHENRFAEILGKRKEHQNRLKQAYTVLLNAINEVQNKSKLLLANMRNPEALSVVFAKEILDLKANLDKVKLPESVAREFFVELADEAACVCGRKMDAVAKDAILNHSKKYLGSNDVSFLNALKSEIGDAIGESIGKSADQLKEVIHQLEKLEQKRQEAELNHEIVKEGALAEDPELQKVEDEKSSLLLEKQRLEENLSKYEEPSTASAIEHITNIKELMNKYDEAENDVEKAMNKLGLKHKRDVLHALLRNIGDKARQAISEAICEESNNRIATLIPNNRIRIDRIDSCLELKDKKGGSVGENLAVAYAFLSTLFNRAEYELPFIVDSPAGALDLEVRKEVGRLIPKLSTQVIAFTITSERDGFVTTLEQVAKDNIQYITLFRKGNAKFDAEAQRVPNTTATLDGYLVPGEAYFDSFHLEIEEANAI